MSERAIYWPDGQRLTLREVILAQVRLLARHLQGQADYGAYLWK